MKIKIPKHYIEISASQFDLVLSNLEDHRKLFFENATEYIIARTEDIFAYVDMNNRVFIHPYLQAEKS